MARMLIGVPLVAASASLLVAEAANAATGESLRTLIASAAFGEVYHLFMWQFWASVAVVAVATAVLRGATGCSRSSLVTAQANYYIASMVVAAVVSAWTIMAFMVLDEKLASTDSDEACEGVILLLIAAAGIGVATGMVPMSGAVVAAASIAAPLSWLWFIARLTTWCVRENGVNTWWTILAAVTVTAGTARFEVLSDQLHHYYRKRLLGAFYHRSEDLSLREVDCTRSPFLLCNTVMNDFVRHPGESRCAPFVMTPLFCGSQRTGFCTTPDTLTTSEVMAVSGGAVALAMGNADASGKLRFLLGLFGISLGRWFPLQSRDDAARRGAPSSWTVLL